MLTWSKHGAFADIFLKILIDLKFDSGGICAWKTEEQLLHSNTYRAKIQVRGIYGGIV